MEFKTHIIDKFNREWEFTAEISGKCFEDERGLNVTLHFEDIFLSFAEILTKLTDITSLEVNFSDKTIAELKLKAEMDLLEAFMARGQDEHDLYPNGTEAI